MWGDIGIALRANNDRVNCGRHICDNVRFGSKADMCGAQADVRYVPIADIGSLDDYIHALHKSVGMLMPSAFAVLRLMANSYLVGCSTGMSFGPLP